MNQKQFKGKLDIKTAAEGIKVAYDNASSLLSDAELLFKNKRYERCFSLSVLAIEESGKSTIIRAMLLTDDPKEIGREWKNYRRHTAKNLTWILPDLVESGARKPEELRKIFDPNSNHGDTLENLKQLSFYTDILPSGNCISPQKVINKDLAQKLLSIAQDMVRIDKVMTSEKELELWVKHLKPVRGQGAEELRKAILKCYDEAVTNGLIEEWKVLVLKRNFE